MVKRLFVSKVLVMLFVLLLFVQGMAVAVDCLEGGYVGCDEALSAVSNFLTNFNYEQYYWAEDFQFTTLNNSRVDSMTFAYYVGHGAPWIITEPDGTVINLATAGGSSHQGWGDVNLRYAAFYSCNVVPSPLEVSDWYSNWISESDDVFDGIRQICGYRTAAAIATGPSISNYFGNNIRNGSNIWQRWFDANNIYGVSGMYASAVMHPDAAEDSYNSCSIPAAPDDGYLRIYYQN